MTKAEIICYDIKKIMRKRKITQAKLADNLGLNMKTANRRLMKGTLTLEDLLKTCEILGLELTITEKE